jgi:hypothetical protein
MMRTTLVGSAGIKPAEYRMSAGCGVIKPPCRIAGLTAGGASERKVAQKLSDRQHSIYVDCQDYERFDDSVLPYHLLKPKNNSVMTAQQAFETLFLLKKQIRGRTRRAERMIISISGVYI